MTYVRVMVYSIALSIVSSMYSAMELVGSSFKEAPSMVAASKDLSSDKTFNGKPKIFLYDAEHYKQQQGKHL